MSFYTHTPTSHIAYIRACIYKDICSLCLMCVFVCFDYCVFLLATITVTHVGARCTIYTMSDTIPLPSGVSLDAAGRRVIPEYAVSSSIPVSDSSALSVPDSSTGSVGSTSEPTPTEAMGRLPVSTKVKAFALLSVMYSHRGLLLPRPSGG